MTATSQGIRQFRREIKLVVGTGGSGLLIENPKVWFSVHKSLQSTPNAATIKCYNLTEQHKQSLKTEYTDIMLAAGYLNNSQQIFTGNIQACYTYQDKTDVVTEIIAGDGDQDYRLATMNETLSAGTSHMDTISKAVATFAKTGGTTKGYIGLTDEARIRGEVFSGPTRKVLSDLAKETGCHWSIQDGQLQFVPVQGLLPNQAIVVNGATGLLGIPELSDKGIKVKCLMNPLIRINGAIQLDNNQVKAKVIRPHLGGSAKQPKSKGPVALDPDGIYKVINMVHEGDNRKDKFQTEFVCIGLNQPLPSNDQDSPEGFNDVG